MKIGTIVKNPEKKKKSYKKESSEHMQIGRPISACASKLPHQSVPLMPVNTVYNIKATFPLGEPMYFEKKNRKNNSFSVLGIAN